MHAQFSQRIACSHGVCSDCELKPVNFVADCTDDHVEYSQWVSVSEEKHNKHGEPIRLKITRKEKQQCTN